MYVLYVSYNKSFLTLVDDIVIWSCYQV